MNILALCGSLQKSSYNRSALKFAQTNAPKGITITQADISKLPFFNQDLEAKPPESVIKLRDQIKSADALLFVTPEYNYSISSVLKNAIEWGSRPYGQGVLIHKPAAIMGAYIGMLGTARAQYHLRQILVQTDTYVMNHPEVMIPFASDKFGTLGNLTDKDTGEKILALIEALVSWSQKFPVK